MDAQKKSTNRIGLSARCHSDAVASIVEKATKKVCYTRLEYFAMKRENGYYTRLFQDSIKSRDRPGLFDFYFCLAPLNVLESVSFGQTISVDDFVRMIDMITGFQNCDYAVSKLENVFYPTMYWQAPEGIVDGILGKFPGCRELDFKVALSLLRLAQYSSIFFQKLVLRCKPLAKD